MSISDVGRALRGALETKNAHIAPELQAVMDAWPSLPDATKAEVVAMVEATLSAQP
jgi:hypothetical protein